MREEFSVSPHLHRYIFLRHGREVSLNERVQLYLVNFLAAQFLEGSISRFLRASIYLTLSLPDAIYIPP
jgi:hypothetical protein